MDELNPTVREQEIYEEMELTSEMVKSIRTLCGTCLRHFVDAKAFKIALVPSADRSMDTCTVCQMRRGYDYVVMQVDTSIILPTPVWVASGHVAVFNDPLVPSYQ